MRCGFFWRFGEHFLELGLALLEGNEEFLFLGLELGKNEVGFLADLGIGSLVLVDGDLRDLAKKNAVDAELASVADSAADQAAKHVASADIRRGNALRVADDEGRGRARGRK